jgi:5-oxoprolinase (ATP-hydrolysing) subunit A
MAAAAQGRIDFNLDLGEGFGIWDRDNDEATLLTLTSSVNLACGFHAGDPGRMRQAVAAAHARGVAVGAHPGLPDRPGFGRRPMTLTPAEVRDYITYQIGALEAFVASAGTTLHHVKLHGELAAQCNRHPAAAAAYVTAVAEAGSSLPVYANPRSEVWTAAAEVGVPAVAEYYADLPLRRDGTRVVGEGGPHGRRQRPAPETIRARVRDFLLTGSVDADDGGRAEVNAGTISVHSDGPSAASFARAVRAGIADAGFRISPDLSPPPADR